MTACMISCVSLSHAAMSIATSNFSHSLTLSILNLVGFYYITDTKNVGMGKDLCFMFLCFFEKMAVPDWCKWFCHQISDRKKSFYVSLEYRWRRKSIREICATIVASFSPRSRNLVLFEAKKFAKNKNKKLKQKENTTFEERKFSGLDFDMKFSLTGEMKTRSRFRSWRFDSLARVRTASKWSDSTTLEMN